MKYILFSLEHLHCGGVERCLIELLNNIDYNKYKVDLLLFNEVGDLIKEVNDNVEIKYVIPNNKYNHKIINRIYKSIKTRLYRFFPYLINREIKKNKYDVEIAYMHGYITKLISKIKSDAIKIAWIHTDIKECKIAQSSNLKKYLHKFNNIVCVSNGVKKSLDKLYPEFKNKSKVIYNIIDKKRILKLSKEEVDFKFKKNTIIGVGRFYNVKRFDLLLKAHKLLKDDGIESNIILVGYGDSINEYKRLIAELNIEDSVEIIGFKENPYPYIANSDIFVLSSDYEGLPTVICEAMALGKPIISTKCSGAIELIGNDEYGILCECGNEYMIKNSIKKVLEDRALLNKLEKKSYEKSKIFNKTNVLAELDTLING